ncbi:MAG: peptide chain release factor 3 [Proteobacteria bacterium]|nr:peptide chain release factor 3 [Pseudomonadota bacterium]
MAIGSRRTFAIISHPDAGKTTLTEKLLLFGGAIQLAGAVKARGERRRARSDWLAVEQKRGISVTASVMTFAYGGHTFNLLDTPGHEDFSEDTYRTLSAVDSAVMVIDAAKGIEAQTRKLFEVCRLRDVPIITFINKLDRDGRDPFALLDEISESLALDTTPVAWPIGMGSGFRGCYDVLGDRFLAFEAGRGDRIADATQLQGLDDPRLAKVLTAAQLTQLRDDVEYARAACPAFDLSLYRAGHLTPVFFGSALKNFGVRELLEGLATLAPPPGTRAATSRVVAPEESRVSGFVFKIQANMDPNHRDRVAFVRICSGQFRRSMKLHHVRTGKMLSVHNPVFFLARERDLAEEAWAGDIIGIPNHGTLRIGDALTEGESLRFTGIPCFAPEILRRVRLGDPMRMKHLRRALEDLAEEGITQLFKPLIGAQWIVGVVGPLQLDVLAARIADEYSVEAGFEAAPYESARWVDAADPAKLKQFGDSNRGSMAEDRDGAPVFLARNAWELNYTRERWPDIRFNTTREQPDS